MEQIASLSSSSAPSELGVSLHDGGASVAVFSHFGDSIWFCQFDPQAAGSGGGRELARWKLPGRDGDIHYGFVPGVQAGAHYGLRADGPYEPERGHRFDPHKLLADPYARAIDRNFVWTPELAAPRDAAIDTASWVPRCIAGTPGFPADQTLACDAGRLQDPSLIYEIAVRTFTRLHPDIPPQQRGTLAGIAHPATIEHLLRLGVSHVELMPVTAWIDERHLAAPGLTNVWGYNPALYMALDPRLAPGGMDDLRTCVAALHAAGIGVLLDVVFNHTGESDVHGASIGLRGLDNAVYYRHTSSFPAMLINDTGCGNTLAAERAPVVRLILDSLRRFALEAGVDGFRFDLAPTMARTATGFSADAPVLTSIAQDPVLRNLIMIAEPWDIGPGGYQLGHFPPRWREWNDRYRDGIRRFWRGDERMAGECATRIAGSPDFFDRPGRRPSASVNFVAAHDGFSLLDCVSYEERHNHANGEDNRDGHSDNHSWNCGVEGKTDDADVLAARKRDVRAMLATLFLSRGTPMVTAGDEFGRSQSGNNNAYAQDNAITWLDWEQADDELAEFTGTLAIIRRQFLETAFGRFLRGEAVEASAANAAGAGLNVPDVAWSKADGLALSGADWDIADQICMTLALDGVARASRIYLVFNRAHSGIVVTLPQPAPGSAWKQLLESSSSKAAPEGFGSFTDALVPGRCVAAFAEMASD